MNKNDPFPPGNAKVGDTVYLVKLKKLVGRGLRVRPSRFQFNPKQPDKAFGIKVRHGRITVVGVKNVNGYNLDITVQFADRKRPTHVAMFDPNSPWQLLILPPWDDTPQLACKYARSNRMLLVRHATNSDYHRYHLVHASCLGAMHVEQSSTEGYELRFDDGPAGVEANWHQSKPWMVESNPPALTCERCGYVTDNLPPDIVEYM